MKNFIKIVFISMVIFGLVATYMNFGSTGTVAPAQQADTQAAFQAPTNAPSTNGPTNTTPVK